MPYVCLAGNHLLPDDGICPEHFVAGRWISSAPGGLSAGLLQYITSFLPVQDHVSFSSSSIVLRGSTAINPRLGEAVRAWSSAQTCSVVTPGFRRNFFLRFMEAVRFSPELEEYIIHACSFRGVSDMIRGNCVLLIRFFNGTAEGLVPASQSQYTNTNTTNLLNMGSSEAHASGQKENSPYISLTGHLPSLLRTSCNAVKMIMYGPSQFHLQLLSQGIQIQGLHARAPAIGVFLVAGNEWEMPSGSTSDRIHLAQQENEVLFDTRQGSLSSRFLFKVDNVV